MSGVEIGLLVASLAVSAFSAVQMQNSAVRSIEDQAKANAINNEMSQAELTRRQRETNEAAAEQQSDRIRLADKQLALLQVAGADAGSGAMTMEQRVSELGFVEGQDLARLEANRMGSIDALQAEKQRMAQGVTNTIIEGKNQAKAATVGAGLQIAGAAVNNATTGYQYSKYQGSGVQIKQKPYAKQTYPTDGTFAP